MMLPATIHGRVGLRFAEALLAHAYDEAYVFLSISLMPTLSPRELRTRFEAMVAYFDPVEAEVIVEMDDWPDKQPHDIGWAYGAIGGTCSSEAVTVTVCDDHGHQLIRNIIWGRP